jgi:hypothetical protein
MIKMNIEEIKKSIQNGNYRITEHAFEEMEEDNLDLDNILYSVNNGEIIEDYPNSRITPSCLIYGNDHQSNPIHSVWGFFKEKLFSVLITVYKPDPSKWSHDFKTRKIL